MPTTFATTQPALIGKALYAILSRDGVALDAVAMVEGPPGTFTGTVPATIAPGPASIEVYEDRPEGGADWLVAVGTIVAPATSGAVGTPVGAVVARIASTVAELADRTTGHRLPSLPSGAPPTLPSCVVRIVSAVPLDGSKADVALSSHRLQVDVFASTDAEASALHDAIRSSLHRRSFGLSGAGRDLVRCLQLTECSARPSTADPSAEGSEVAHWSADYRVFSDRT